MSARRERVSVTFTGPYLNFLNHVVKDGLYARRGDAVMAGLRLLAKEHKMPLTPKEAGA